MPKTPQEIYEGCYSRRYVETGPKFGVRPFERIVSGCGFDHLPGVLVLELYRAQISKCGV